MEVLDINGLLLLQYFIFEGVWELIKVDYFFKAMSEGRWQYLTERVQILNSQNHFNANI